jgi:cytochrome c2
MRIEKSIRPRIYVVAFFTIVLAIALFAAVRSTPPKRIGQFELTQEDEAALGGSVERGVQIVVTRGCFRCHGTRTPGSGIAPRLLNVKFRKSPAQLFRWLQNPQAVKPGTKMPTFGFTPEEIRDVIAFLEVME